MIIYGGIYNNAGSIVTNGGAGGSGYQSGGAGGAGSTIVKKVHI
jgi:hypothetical protein